MRTQTGDSPRRSTRRQPIVSTVSRGGVSAQPRPRRLPPPHGISSSSAIHCAAPPRLYGSACEGHHPIAPSDLPPYIAAPSLSQPSCRSRGQPVLPAKLARPSNRCPSASARPAATPHSSKHPTAAPPCDHIEQSAGGPQHNHGRAHTRTGQMDTSVNGTIPDAAHARDTATRHCTLPSCTGTLD